MKRHQWEIDPNIPVGHDPRVTKFVCKVCGMDVISTQMPKREKVVCWTAQYDNGHRRFSCDEYILFKVQES
jgi:hypothetical protein